MAAVGPHGFPGPRGFCLPGRPGPTRLPPSLLGHLQAFSGSFPRGTREKVLGRFPGGPSWSLPEMAWQLGALESESGELILSPGPAKRRRVTSTPPSPEPRGAGQGVPTLGRRLGPWEMTQLPCPGASPSPMRTRLELGPEPHPDGGPGGWAVWPEQVPDGAPWAPATQGQRL